MGFLLLFLDVFDATLQTLPELVGGVLERAPDFGADAVRVRVRVVERGELGGEFGAEAFGKGVGDLCDGIGDAEGD